VDQQATRRPPIQSGATIYPSRLKGSQGVTPFLKVTVDSSAPQSAGDLLADLVGCCEDGPADLSSNPVHLFAKAL
jgi:hypothetical protein